MSNAELLAILKDERQQQAALRQEPLLECPYDGTPLEERNGVLNCPMGDFRVRQRAKGKEFS